MVVCICNRYREQDIRNAAHSGLRSVEVIYERLGAGPSCGRCLKVAEQVIRDVHMGSSAGNPAPVAGSA